jgi:hypothetical protein
MLQSARLGNAMPAHPGRAMLMISAPSAYVRFDLSKRSVMNSIP